jgi:6-phosphogluconolactonase
VTNQNFSPNFSRRQFLKISSVGVVAAVSRPMFAHAANDALVYVGTYTSGKSEGIYIYRMDQMTGELRRIGSVKSDNPSFLALDPAKRYLYAVNENPEGKVSAFRINRQTGDLSPLNQQSSAGADPCYLSVDNRSRSLLVANYTSGSVAVLPIQHDGTLGEAIDVEQHEGSGPREQQKGPHAHCIKLDQANRHAFATDLGIDKLLIYRFNAATGKLEPAKQSSAFLHAGAGPRHFTIHPNGKYLYVINELDSSLTTFKYNAAEATLTAFESVSALPRDFSGQSFCADVHVSRSGRFIYGSNRGHNSIVVFAIDPQSGRLSLVEHVSTEGNWPRNFTIDPTGKFLLVANQRSDNVVLFRIDQQTGRLTSTGQTTEIPAPVCLQFL